MLLSDDSLCRGIESSLATCTLFFSASNLDTKTNRGTQLLYQCVHFLNPLAFTNASIETSAPFSVEQTATGANRFSCCLSVTMQFCRCVVHFIISTYVWNRPYGGCAQKQLTNDNSIVGSLKDRAIKLDDVPVAEDAEDFSLRNEHTHGINKTRLLHNNDGCKTNVCESLNWRPKRHD